MKRLFTLSLIATIFYVGITAFLPPPISRSCDNTITRHLIADTIKLLQSSPVKLLPPAGVGYHYQISSLEGTATAHGTPFSGTTLYTYLLDKQHPTGNCLMLQDSFSQLTHCTNGELNDYNLASNAALYVSVDTIFEPLGNTEIDIQVTYRIIADTGTTTCEPTGSGVLCTTDTIPISSAQIKDLNNTPFTLVSAPPTGFYLKIIGVDAIYAYGTTPYVGNTILLIYEADTARSIGSNNTILTSTASGLNSFAVGAGGALLGEALPLKMITDNGNTSAGDGTMKIIVTYMTLPINGGICVSGLVGATGPVGPTGSVGATGNTGPQGGTKGYERDFGSTVISPANATTYYLGADPAFAPTTTADRRRVYYTNPNNDTIRSMTIYCDIGTTLGSNQNVQFYIRKNNTTDFTVSTTGQLTAIHSIISNNALSVPLTYMDYFEIKIVTPTWVTRPTNVVISGSYYIE